MKIDRLLRGAVMSIRDEREEDSGYILYRDTLVQLDKREKEQEQEHKCQCQCNDRARLFRLQYLLVKKSLCGRDGLFG